MLRIVRDPVSACQAEYARIEFKLSVLPQASGTLSHSLNSLDVFVVLVLVLALVAAVVVLTAVWSRDGERRKAAVAALDRLIRWHP